MFWLLLYTGYILYVYLIKCPCRFYMENMKGARMFDETTESHHDVLMPQAEAPSGLTGKGRKYTYQPLSLCVT